MTVTQLLPIIREFHEARGDNERAAILLRVPDATLLKYRRVFHDACRRSEFQIGLEFLALRCAALTSTRDADGLLPQGLAMKLDEYRVTLIKGAAGAN